MLIISQSQFIMWMAAFIGILTGMSIPLRAIGVAAEQGALALASIGSIVLMLMVPGARQRARDLLFSRFGLIVAIMLLSWVASIVCSFNPIGSLKIGGRTVALLFGTLTLWAVLCEHPHAHRIMLKFLMLSSWTIGLLLQVPFNDILIETVHAVAPDKAFAASAMCLVPVMVWAGLRLGGKWRWAGYVYPALALAIMIQTYNRAALAGFLAMAIIFAVLLILHSRRYAWALLSVVLIGTAAVFLWVLPQEMNAPSIDGLYLPKWLIDPHRQFIWQFVYHLFLEHPWVGVGIDQSNYVPGAGMSAPGFDGEAALVPSHPHNWALEILSETGLVGFLPFLIALGYAFLRLIKRIIASSDEGDIALLMLMVGFWTSALFNHTIWATWWQLTLFTLFAIIASRPRSAA